MYTLNNQGNKFPEKFISKIDKVQTKNHTNSISIILNKNSIEGISDFVQDLSRNNILLSDEGYSVLKKVCLGLKKTHYEHKEYVIIQFFTELLGPNNNCDVMSRVTVLLQRYNPKFYSEKGHLIDDKVKKILQTRERGGYIRQPAAEFSKVGKAPRARVPYRLG